MGYEGRDRRRYRVALTDGYEYHLRDELCIAVRERETESWLLEHPAVGGRLVQPDRARSVAEGDVLTFDNGHVSAPVRSVARPSHYVKPAE